ncbi:AoPex11B [Pestalotiopsis sp. NC0098]|nr:AoPex11B [Pestalotiopsis sp. NC0098]
MSSHTFEQFIRFTTDSVGLERTFRLLQAIAQILSSYPALLGLFVSLLELVSVDAAPSYSAAHGVLLVLRQRLGLARRFFRLFRFLDSFHAAQKLYANIATQQLPSGKQRPSWVYLEAYLDVLGRTFNGMYLLLESSTIVDALQIDGLAAWGPKWERTVGVEAQRFWLFALVCAVASGALKALQVLAYTPVPPVGDVTQSEKVAAQDKEKEKTASPAAGGDGQEGEEEEEFDVRKEQERLRGLVRQTRKRRVLWRREVRAKLHGLGRSTAANALDIVLPGVIVGWIDADPGTVGVVMFVTTVLTGLDVWERCGREVSEGK